MSSQLLPFHTQIANAWKTFIHRWGSAVLIQLPMIIPGILMYPLIVEYLAALDAGTDPALVFQTTVYGTTFLWGFVLFLLVGVLTTASLMILFVTKEKISFMTAITSAVKRYIPVLYTSILSAIAVLAALLPAYALNYWYYVAARTGLTLDGNGIVALDAVIAIAIVALLIPAAIVAVWLMYAPLLTAVNASPAGFTALVNSKRLVHGHLWQVLWRIIGASILVQIISMSVQSLYLASSLIPFIMGLIAIAFFVEIYKELHEGGA